MKFFLSKLVCLIILVSFFGCSNGDSEELIENQVLKTENTVVNENSHIEERRSHMHYIYVECPVTGPTQFNTCISGLNQLFTVYSAFESQTCPGLFKVWVNSAEYHAFYAAIAEEGTAHKLLPPFTNEPQAFPKVQFNPCFN